MTFSRNDPCLYATSLTVHPVNTPEDMRAKWREIQTADREQCHSDAQFKRLETLNEILTPLWDASTGIVKALGLGKQIDDIFVPY